jgi:hypothetical protein
LVLVLLDLARRTAQCLGRQKGRMVGHRLRPPVPRLHDTTLGCKLWLGILLRR